MAEYTMMKQKQEGSNSKTAKLKTANQKHPVRLIACDSGCDYFTASDAKPI